MTTAPIARYPMPELASLPEDVRSRILAVQEKTGFVPNVFLVLARRPDEFRAFAAAERRKWAEVVRDARITVD